MRYRHRESIVARGFTNRPGQPHAEAMALRQVTDDLAEVSVYATLEPCSLDGRTPSCAKALVRRGVAAVYLGLIDPHWRNRGAGLTILREAGIQVATGLLADQVRRESGRYLLS